MNVFDQIGPQSRSTYEQHIETLERARQWVGLDRGRTLEYPRLIREFHEQRVQDLAHLLAYNESCEITDIATLWEHHIDNYLGLKDKIREAFSRGPVVPENENPSTSSNKPRNDAFVYFLAGRLLAAGIDVITVDGIMKKNEPGRNASDISIQVDGSLVNIQCKRPRSEQKLRRAVHDARKQLTASGARKNLGIVALDCAVILRPPNTLLRTSSPEVASQFIADGLTNLYASKLDRKYQRHVLGFIMFARIPAVARRSTSPILSQQGQPFTYFTRESTCTFLVIANGYGANTMIVSAISDKIKTSLQEHPN
jgi:hypothetical protein